VELALPGGGSPWDDTDFLTNAEKIELLQNVYLSDIRGALRSLLGRRERLSFPEGFWKGILLNQYIDFGQIIDDHFAIMPSYCETIIVGGASSSTNISKSVAQHPNVVTVISNFRVYASLFI